MSADGSPTQGFGRQGKVLAAASAGVLLFLYASTVGVIAAGAERWRTLVNPDPAGGAITALFFLTSLLLLLFSIAATFVLLSYAGEYRNAWTDHIRATTGTRWTGSLYILVGIPFFVIGFFMAGISFQLMWLAAFLVFGVGAAHHLVVYLREDRAAP